MTKPINNDVVGYKDDFFKGLSLRETIFGFIALVTGGAGMLTLYFYAHLPLNLAVTLCIPFIAIIGLAGFYHKNGMTLLQIVKNIIRIRKAGPLTYISHQPNEPWESYIEPDTEEEPATNKPHVFSRKRNPATTDPTPTKREGDAYDS